MRKEVVILFFIFLITLFIIKRKMKNSDFDSMLFSIIAEHEGFRPKMYLDGSGNPTIGFGTLIDTPEEQYLRTATITKEQGYILAKKYIDVILGYLNTIKGLNDKKKAALASLGYNIGLGALKKSTLMKKVIANPNDKTIELEFLAYNKDQDKTGKLVAVSGLTIRRQKESNLYFS